MSLFLIFIPAALFFLGVVYYAGVVTTRLAYESAEYACSNCSFPIFTAGQRCQRCGCPTSVHAIGHPQFDTGDI